MPGIVVRIILAVIVAIAVWLACLFLGVVLGTLNVPLTDAIASFLTHWGWTIGVLAGLWYFFTGQTWPRAS